MRRLAGSSRSADRVLGGCGASILLALIALPSAPVADGMAARPAGAGASLPAKLSGTGLWADPASRTLADDVLPFAPQYPLWSDGATKRRWIRLPPGEAVDASDPDAWAFPRGTELWKEFSLGGRVETRYLRLGDDGTWRFAAYVWDADGRDATLAPEAGVRAVATTAAGSAYDVPGRADCAACHAAGPSAVLGFSALQLSGDRDPLAPHAEAPPEGSLDLAGLAARGLVRGLPARLLAEPPRIDARTPTERAALGYLHGNCGACHTDRGELASLGLDLAHALADPRDSGAVATTVGAASRFRCSSRGAPTAKQRVVAGDPDASVLWRRMTSRHPIAQMPPLGTRDRDEQALELLAAWIRELGEPAAIERSEAGCDAPAPSESAPDATREAPAPPGRALPR